MCNEALSDDFSFDGEGMCGDHALDDNLIFEETTLDCDSSECIRSGWRCVRLLFGVAPNRAGPSAMPMTPCLTLIIDPLFIFLTPLLLPMLRRTRLFQWPVNEYMALKALPLGMVLYSPNLMDSFLFRLSTLLTL